MIVDLVGDILRQKPSLSEYEHRCLIVSGIPVVGDDRFARLKNVLGKIFGKLNADYTDYYPLDNNKTKVRFIFLPLCRIHIEFQCKIIQIFRIIVLFYIQQLKLLNMPLLSLTIIYSIEITNSESIFSMIYINSLRLMKVGNHRLLARSMTWYE